MNKKPKPQRRVWVLVGLNSQGDPSLEDQSYATRALAHKAALAYAKAQATALSTKYEPWHSWQDDRGWDGWRCGWNDQNDDESYVLFVGSVLLP